MAIPVTIRLQSADFDIAAEIAALTKGNTDVSFGAASRTTASGNISANASASASAMLADLALALSA